MFRNKQEEESKMCGVYLGQWWVPKDYYFIEGKDKALALNNPSSWRKN